MTEYIDIEAARASDGLRLVLTQGVPGPWGEAAKGLFHVKQVPYVAVAQQGGGANDELLRWTGYANAPQAIYRDERPRIGWSEILFLAERLGETPPLIPADSQDRTVMFGLLHEIAGEMGFAWARRLQLFRPILSAPRGGEAGALPAAVVESVERMAARYGYSAETALAADARVNELLELFSEKLRGQRRRGSPYFVGDQLSAADIYWAAFAAMLEPLEEDQNPMPAMLRVQYTVTDPSALAHADPLLLQHRDRIYQDHLALPLSF